MAEEQTYSKKQQPTQEFWDRFLGSTESDSHRAVAFSERDYSDFGPSYTKKNQKIQKPSAFGLPQIQSDLLRHIMLTTVDTDAVFSFLINFVRASQGFANDTVDDVSKSIIGYVFDQTRFGEYKLQLFERKGEVGVSCQLIDGFAPTLQSFWDDLKSALERENFVSPSEEMMETSEDDDFFADSDEEFEGLDLEKASYLSLDQNPEVIGSYVEDLKDPNFMLHTLTLLAWNLQNQQNFETARKVCAQELFSSVVACLVSTATELTLPLVRAASILAAKLISEANVKVTREQETALVQTIFAWTLNNASTNSVTRSEEIATVLSEQLANLANISPNSRSVLETIQKETEFEQVRYNIGNVLHSIPVA